MEKVTKQTPIFFKFGWRGREAGHVDRELDDGVKVELIRRGMARVATDEEAAAAPAKAPATKPEAKPKAKRGSRK